MTDEDRRPRYPVPPRSAEFLPVMQLLHEHLPALPDPINLKSGELAELIERYIAFVDKRGNLVRLPQPFVRRYLHRCRRSMRAPE